MGGPYGNKQNDQIWPALTQGPPSKKGKPLKGYPINPAIPPPLMPPSEEEPVPSPGAIEVAGGKGPITAINNNVQQQPEPVNPQEMKNLLLSL